MMSKVAAHTGNRDNAPGARAMAGVEGFWIVRVENPELGEPTGATLTLKAGHVTGGDDTYYYLGTYAEAEDRTLTLSIDAIRFAGDPLPELDDYSDMLFLQLTLKPANGDETWCGKLIDRVEEDAVPVSVIGRRMAVIPGEGAASGRAISGRTR